MTSSCPPSSRWDADLRQDAHWQDNHPYIQKESTLHLVLHPRGGEGIGDVAPHVDSKVFALHLIPRFCCISPRMTR